MYTLHDSLNSGNAWKVRIMLSQLGLPYRRVTHVLTDNTTRTPEFLAMNPVGKVPLLIFPSGEMLAESNAILQHLAQGTSFLPEGMDRSRTLQWMFFEQAESLKAFAFTRFWTSIAKRPHDKAAEIATWQVQGNKVLRVLQQHLATRDFMVASRYTIADLAFYPYVSMADQGGYVLADYPAVGAWIERVRAQPGHVPLLTEAAASAPVAAEIGAA